MKNRLELPEELRKQALSDIKQHFLEQRDEEIGDLRALLLLDFFVEKLAPAYYNLGVNHAKAILLEKLEDLHGLEIWR